MASSLDIRVPRMADGVDTATVVKLLVSEGQEIQKEQALVELETEKAVAPIPSPQAGKVSKIHVREGSKVAVGQILVSISGAGDVVGIPAPAQVARPLATAVPMTTVATNAPKIIPGIPLPASPSVRHLAREIGLDLSLVAGSEHGGRITLDDVRAYVQRLQQGAIVAQGGTTQQEGAPAVATAAPQSIDFSQWGSVTKKSVSSLRRTIAQKMTESWTTIPHVTQFEDADITGLLSLRKKHAAAYEKKGAKLTLTIFVLKAIVAALKEYPKFNASLDEARQEIVFKNYYHIGVAVDTEGGLIVPVLKDVDKKSMFELAKELQQLAEKTRQRKIAMEDLQGGTFTLSNLGGIAGTYFSPIINKPQVAILGIGKGKQMLKRTMLPLSLSYDHRVVDGADGARFIRALTHALENFKNVDIKL